MERKTQEQLLTELNANIRSAGNGSKTTADDVRQILTSLIAELFNRTEEPINDGTSGSAIVIEQDLTSNSALTVPSVAAVRNAFDATNFGAVYNSIADAITSASVRTYYDTAQLAINGAGEGGTVNIYSTKYSTPTTPGGAFAGLSFPAQTLTINMYGLALTSPDANTDILVFRGGFKTIFNGFNSTVITNSALAGDPNGIGWTIWGRGNPGMDLTINNLDIILSTINSTGFVLSSAGTYKYTGNIDLALSPVSSTVSRNRQAIYIASPGVLDFFGKGNITARGFAPELNVSKNPALNNCIFDIRGATNNIYWEGNINAYEDVIIKMVAGSKLELTNGVLNAKGRVDGYPLFSSSTGTVVLNNYSILCNAGEEAIRADTVILRGNSVVVGNIVATTIIDERPVATGHITGGVTSILEFIFEAETADAFVRTMGAYQAGEYQTNSLQNVATVAYTINNAASPATLPFTLGIGDKLEVRITRESMTQAAAVILQN
ncbi:hypothetical protein [Hymenobacter rubripertinctus]|uniref:Uncharacterized protein n=1 Tax=Hymenobacter rubripertinctus TaxID=2029981 RepID=A0A418QJT7_9BACT|nr:hypothetical protein [Hymenobacter rubripertinctus]RIY05457.1 hypothetical protein D0T11_20390 [Hymenobacter rubripertinctus]